MAHPKKIVQPDDLPVRKTHSQVVTVAGGTLVFVAGMTSRSEKDASPVHHGDMRAQVRQVCQNIGRALRSVGADFSDVVKTTTFTTDVEEYHRVADERFKYFTSDLPTSALIGVKRLSAPELMVEIEAMAVIPAKRRKTRRWRGQSPQEERPPERDAHASRAGAVSHRDDRRGRAALSRGPT